MKTSELSKTFDYKEVILSKQEILDVLIMLDFEQIEKKYDKKIAVKAITYGDIVAKMYDKTEGINYIKYVSNYIEKRIKDKHFLSNFTFKKYK